MEIRKRNIVFVAASLLALLLYLWLSEGKEGLIGVAFSSLNVGWLLCAVGMMVLYWVLESFCLHAVLRRLKPGYPFLHSFRVSMIGQLFNNITPFASGGQPAQALYLTGSGVSLGVAGSALLSKFILYQATLTVYSTTVLILCYRRFVLSIQGFGFFILLGYAVSLLVMAALICVFFFRRFTEWIVHGSVSVLSRFRLVRCPERLRSRADEELDSFHESFEILRHHKGMAFEGVFYSLLQLTAFFLIPYFICLAFGVQSVSPGAALSAEAIVLMFSSFIPLPGAMGGAELGFYNVFSTCIPEKFLNVSVFLWRLITFYLPIVVGLFFCLFSRKKGSVDHSKTII